MSMEAETSDSQSSGQSIGGRRKKTRKPIQFKLHVVNRNLDKNVGLGCFHLEMPYDPVTTRFKKDSYPLLFFDVKDGDQMEALKRMNRLSHPNILKVYLVNQGKDQKVQVYAEPYSGVLSTLLKNSSLVNLKTNLVPSSDFRARVSEVVDGLNYLRENGEYHGNFSWDTTFYWNDTQKMITKLANFERKGFRSLKECQVADCVSLGLGLAELSQYVQQRHGVPAISCCLIDDLSSCLMSVTTDTLVMVMDNIKDCVFFWDEKRRRNFFATEVVPNAWNRVEFEDSFIHSPSMPAMPWTNESFDGYCLAMKDYRAKIGIEVYKKNDWKDFLRCITGMYIHQNELDVVHNLRSVDSSVHATHPRLCLDLKAAVDSLPWTLFELECSEDFWFKSH